MDKRRFYNAVLHQLRADGLVGAYRSLSDSLNLVPFDERAQGNVGLPHPSLYDIYQTTEIAQPPRLQNPFDSLESQRFQNLQSRLPFVPRPPPPQHSEDDLDDEDDSLKLPPKPEPQELTALPFETRFITTHKAGLRCSAFSSNGEVLVTGSADCSIKVLSVHRLHNHMLLRRGTAFIEDAKPVLKTFYDHTQQVNDVQFMRGSTRFVSASTDASLRVFDVSKRKCIQSIVDISPVTCLSLHPPSNEWLLAGTEDNVIRLYNLTRHKCYVSSIGDAHKGGVNDVDYSSDGRLFVSVARDRAIKLWDGRTNRCVNTMNVPCVVYSVRFSRNGRYFLTGGSDYVPKLWDLSTGKTIREYDVRSNEGFNIQEVPRRRSLPTHTRFSADESKILSSMNDKVLVFDARTGALEFINDGHAKAITTVAFSPVEMAFVSGSEDARARFFAWVRNPIPEAIPNVDRHSPPPPPPPPPPQQPVPRPQPPAPVVTDDDVDRKPLAEDGF